MPDDRTFEEWRDETAASFEVMAIRNEQRALFAKNPTRYRRRAQAMRLIARVLRAQES